MKFEDIKIYKGYVINTYLGKFCVYVDGKIKYRSDNNSTASLSKIITKIDKGEI